MEVERRSRQRSHPAFLPQKGQAGEQQENQAFVNLQSRPSSPERLPEKQRHLPRFRRVHILVDFLFVDLHVGRTAFFIGAPRNCQVGSGQSQSQCRFGQEKCAAPRCRFQPHQYGRIGFEVRTLYLFHLFIHSLIH